MKVKWFNLFLAVAFSVGMLFLVPGKNVSAAPSLVNDAEVYASVNSANVSATSVVTESYTETYKVNLIGPNLVDKTGVYTIQLKVNNVVRAWTRLTVRAVWEGGVCVRIVSSSRSHWVDSGWGSWKYGASKLGSASCATSHIRYSYDDWDAPSGYPNYHCFIKATVQASQPGLFIWQTLSSPY